MRGDHVPFSMLCDLYDNILSPIERDTVIIHLRTCSECKIEFENLNKLLGMLSYLKYFGIKSEYEFELKTIKQIKSRKKKNLLFNKFVPSIAAAASILIILGIVFFNTGLMNDKTNQDFDLIRDSEDFVDLFEPGVDFRHIQYREINSEYGINKTLQILNNCQARHIRVVDYYIEGEVCMSDYNRVIRELGNIDYSNFGRGISERNFTEARLDTGFFLEEDFVFSYDLNSLLDVVYNRFIKFRINCK